MSPSGPTKPAIVLAASLILMGLSGCVYRPFGPCAGPACSAPCPEQGPCPAGYGNSWYDPTGLPAADPAAASCGPDGSVRFGADVCTCGGCDVAEGYLCPALPLLEELYGPLQCRFFPVPVRPVFSDYEPAIYPAPPLDEPYMAQPMILPDSQTQPQPVPRAMPPAGAMPNELPPPGMEGPSQDTSPSMDKTTRVPSGSRRPGGSWIFLPARSTGGGNPPQTGMASPKKKYPWY